MSAAEHVQVTGPELLGWDEICARYPDQFVVLVDIEPVALRSPEIKMARVIGHGDSRRSAYTSLRGPSMGASRAVVFTGKSTAPFLRPSFVLDDEALDMIARPLTQRGATSDDEA